jgi:hypothetical protein
MSVSAKFSFLELLGAVFSQLSLQLKRLIPNTTRLTRVRGLGATPRKGKALRSSESQSLCAVARGRPARPE